MPTPRSLIGRIDATGVPLLLARLAVGGMFAYLAIMKLRDPITFMKLTKQYGVLPLDPPLYLNLTAAVVPWLELVCAVALILGLARRGAALIMVGLLLFFTPMLILHARDLLLHSGKFATFCAVKFDCGCGTGEVLICPKLVENIALLLGALLALFSASQRYCLSSWLTRRRTAAPPAGALSTESACSGV